MCPSFSWKRHQKVYPIIPHTIENHDNLTNGYKKWWALEEIPTIFHIAIWSNVKVQIGIFQIGWILEHSLSCDMRFQPASSFTLGCLREKKHIPPIIVSSVKHDLVAKTFPSENGPSIFHAGLSNSKIYKAMSHTVDGWNPKQPPGMYETLWDNGKNYLSTGARFQPSTVWLMVRFFKQYQLWRFLIQMKEKTPTPWNSKLYCLISPDRFRKSFGPVLLM